MGVLNRLKSRDDNKEKENENKNNENLNGNGSRNENESSDGNSIGNEIGNGSGIIIHSHTAGMENFVSHESGDDGDEDEYDDVNGGGKNKIIGRDKKVVEKVNGDGNDGIENEDGIRLGNNNNNNNNDNNNNNNSNNKDNIGDTVLNDQVA